MDQDIETGDDGAVKEPEVGIQQAVNVAVEILAALPADLLRELGGDVLGPAALS